MPPQHNFTHTLARAAATWVVLSLVCLFQGGLLIEPALPILTLVMDQISNDYFPVLTLVKQEGADILRMSATLLHPLILSPEQTLNTGARMTVGIHLYHALVPLVILFTGLTAWPAASRRHRLALLLIGIPALLLIWAATLPFLLGSHIETLLTDRAAVAGVDRKTSWVVAWAILIESGGMWMLSLLGVISSHWFGKPRTRTAEAERIPSSEDYSLEL